MLSSGFDPQDTECTAQCRCSQRGFNPICGSDGVEYTSPCSAGCSHVNNRTDGSILVSQGWGRVRGA